MTTKFHLDKITYVQDTTEIAFRDGVFEYNSYRDRVLGVRVYKNGCLYICSSNNARSHDELLDRLEKVGCTSIIPWYNKEYYSGRVVYGEPADKHSLYQLVKDVTEDIVGQGIKCEVIGVYKKTSIEINAVTENACGVEERHLYEIYVYPYTLYMGKLLTTGFYYVGDRIDGLRQKVENIADEIRVAFTTLLKARRLNPIYAGKWFVVLSGEASPTLYHELTHLLQGDEPVKLRKGTTMSSELTMYEDPFFPGPLRHVFDDELYPSWRRKLVEKGVVVDHLHTRTTCSSNNSRPGNARGLFTRPKPLHHQLIVLRGTWSLDEMLIESRRSIVVSKIVKAELTSDYIRIIPELSWVAEKDRLSPVKINEISIPLSKLSEVIVGLGKRLYERASYEKNMVVYEVAPETLLEARVV